ncbi:MAG: hypothetical protein HFF85_06540 [Oscillibacter sp.]|jgi:hypothetical protein|nr:hypothetical protein [Oscillibacter sp.]MCI9376039.1 hypothetical protein [Oscillibacter sp.]
MLRKLIKHEFHATGRTMLPLYLILLLTAAGSNIAGRWMLDSQIFAVSLLGGLIIFAFIIAIFAVFVEAFWLMIQRFYKNLLQDEGYLMMTLPVSVHQHVWAKLTVSAVWFLATISAVILASMIVAYDVHIFQEFFHLIGDIFRVLQKLKISEAFNGTVIIIEGLALIFLALAAFSLQFYAALAMGHSMANHKMVWSVGCFFGFQFAVQFVGSLLLVSLSKMRLFRFLNNWDPEPIVAVHVGLLMAIGLVVIYGTIFYIVTIFFLKKRLNLE